MESESDPTSLRGERQQLRVSPSLAGSRPVLNPQQVISNRYEIVRLIDRGGMGEVYEAFDTELRSIVALKVLRSELCADARFIERLRNELQLARRITHHAVCRVFDFGRHPHLDGDLVYLTMEFLDGENLSSRLLRCGPFTAAEALEIAQQVGAGLTAAHNLGIVHRDFKSSNVILQSADGRLSPKITDFGLASTLENTNRLTSEGRSAGTPAYMAPEQFEGKATIATDVYAFGLVLLEMLSGLRSAPNGISREAQPLDAKWSAVIHKCLAYKPSERFASIQDALGALSGIEKQSSPARSRMRRAILAACLLTALAAIILLAVRLWPGPQGIRRVAVLPFMNETADPGLNYLADGITDRLIDRLSQSPNLLVLSRTAVFRRSAAQARTPDPIEMGRKLDAQAILVGNLRVKSDELAIAVELVDVATQQRLWGDQYQRRLADLPQIEQAVANDILRQLRLKLDRPQYTPDFETLREYLKGRYEWNKRTTDGYKKAVEHFRRAIDRDPLYAAAYAGLADAYSFQSGLRPPDEIFPPARAAAVRAIELDPSAAEGHAALAFILLNYDWDWAGTERECKRALELNPNYASAYSIYARVLAIRGIFGEAVDQIRRAQELDPLSLGIANGLGFTYYLSRDYTRAAETFKRVLEIEPTYSSSASYLAYSYAGQNRLSEAIAIYERLLAKTPEEPGLLADLGRAYALAGRYREAKTLADKLQETASKGFVLPTLLAELDTAMGDNKRAMAHLEQAYQRRTWQLMLLRVEPVWDPIRHEPAFQELLRRLKLI